MGKAELESAISSLETWIQLFGILVAIGIVGEVGVGVRHWILNRRLQAVLRSEDVERETEIARLNKEAGDARKAAGDAVERAAEANKRTEDERLARVKIEERLAPRSLSQHQQAEMIAKLGPLAGRTIDLFKYPNDAESTGIAEQIDQVLMAAGWMTRGFQPMVSPGRPISGILIETDPSDETSANAASVLMLTLLAAGLVVQPPVSSLPNVPTGYFGSGRPDATIRLTIGKK